MLVTVLVHRLHKWVRLSTLGSLSTSSAMRSRLQAGGFEVRSSMDPASCISCVVSSAIEMNFQFLAGNQGKGKTQKVFYAKIQMNDVMEIESVLLGQLEEQSRDCIS